MKKAVRIGIAFAIAVPVIAIVVLSIRVERQSQRDEAKPADVILVLGAAEYRGKPSPVLKARLDHALELYRRKLSPLIMTTGGAGGEYVFTEGTVGRDYLTGQGVPPESVIVENEGESTVQSTTTAIEIMRRMGLRSAIVVSDGYHIYRVKRMLQVHGIAAYGSPRKERNAEFFRDHWNYVRQAIGYLLWRAGVPV
jgi:uncharacterized SAM-binding protein YcdF (DUF218 family)